MTRTAVSAAVALALSVGSVPAAAQVRLADASDRAALRTWFVLLVDAQFYRPTPDVVDCAGLVRHAVREALRPHSPEWLRQMALPRVAPDVRDRPAARDGALPLFRVPADAEGGERWGEFADARTLVELNARFLGREAAALRPGDLLYFHQHGRASPDHLMVFVGRSSFEPEGNDWIVYHTGPDADGPGTPGEMRKVRLADLVRHPAPHWRPTLENERFVGLFRLEMM